jgi:ABC-type branched-subunit amino acid transport system ATPase component/ABC-type branched-subunit amino acid transport system permease subunit
VSVGSLALGVFEGLLIGLLGVGLVLTYRTSRFLNLAYGQLGALPAMLLAKLSLDHGWPYWPALGVCLAVGALTGVAVERVFVSRLVARTSSAVSALLLTVGVAQLLLFLTLVPAVRPDGFRYAEHGYPVPFEARFHLGGVAFGGQHVAIAVFVPALLVGIELLLRRTAVGARIRATASNPDEARLCGIAPGPVRALTWALAGTLSTFSAVLASPSQGSLLFAQASVSSLGSTQLLSALGAAAFGGFSSMPLAIAGGVALGVVNQLTLATTSNGGLARLVVFVLILAVVFLRGRVIGEAFATRGAAVEDRPPLRVPPAVAGRPLVRHGRTLLVVGGLVLGVLAPLLPPLRAESARFQLSVILVYAVVAVSLTALTGWAGQLSLGHMAVVGVGAYLAARLGTDGWPLLPVLAVGALAGAVVTVSIGVPALRVRGLTLAVTTLGLAVVASEWLFRTRWFTGSVTSLAQLEGPMPPVGGLTARGMTWVYWSALAVLTVVALAASSLRRSTPGRLMVAVRDDERAAAAYGVAPLTVKLGALGVSGAIAGVAGVLWANAWQTVTPSQFAPELSMTLLALPVVGGVGSVAGAVAAAVVLYFPTLFWSGFLGEVFGDTARTAFYLSFSGLGVIAAVLYWPTGLAGAVQRLWERVLAVIERQVTSGPRDNAGESVLVAENLELSFGGVRALDGATIEVRDGEIVGLIGPNGAGKSTLINVVSGVLRPDGGSVRFMGRDVTTYPAEVRAVLGMSRSFQAANLFPGLTVRETVEAVIGARRRVGTLAAAVRAPWVRLAERRIAQEAADLLNRMGLTPWADSLTSELSTGTRRICDLCVQVALRPRVLLLDEPTAGVAQRETEAFGPLLRRLREELGCAMVVVEHDMPLLMGLCDRIYAMESGRVIAHGSPEEVRNDPTVIASYLGTDQAAIERSGGSGTFGRRGEGVTTLAIEQASFSEGG